MLLQWQGTGEKKYRKSPKSASNVSFLSGQLSFERSVEASSDDSSTRIEYKNVLRFLQMNFFPIDKACPGKTVFVSSWLLQNPREYFHRRMQRLSHLEQFWEERSMFLACWCSYEVFSFSAGIINLNRSSSVLNSLRHHLQYNLPLKFYYTKLRN